MSVSLYCVLLNMTHWTQACLSVCTVWLNATHQTRGCLLWWVSPRPRRWSVRRTCWQGVETGGSLRCCSGCQSPSDSSLPGPPLLQLHTELNTSELQHILHIQIDYNTSTSLTRIELMTVIQMGTFTTGLCLASVCIGSQFMQSITLFFFFLHTCKGDNYKCKINNS